MTPAAKSEVLKLRDWIERHTIIAEQLMLMGGDLAAIKLYRQCSLARRAIKRLKK